MGSPPRTRGEAYRSPSLSGLFGITPAYAGRRQAGLCAAPQSWDHPRVRGEKHFRHYYRRIERGSPPRTRGEGYYLLCPGSVSRITPAYAGRRTEKAAEDAGDGDHPRVRGEKHPDDPNAAADEGSPPRTRGEEYDYYATAGNRRITPAYAGRSHRLRGHLRQGQDHPRVRGEKMGWQSDPLPLWGSPPRTRGEANGR